MSDEKEIWKWIPGYKGYYKVSNFGRVQAVKDFFYVRTWISGVPAIKRTYKRKVCKGIVTPTMGDGYPSYRLRTESSLETFHVHTLVLTAFVGPRPKNKECRHLNDDRTDNRLENLVWGTRSQNMMDQFRNNRRSHPRIWFGKKGENHSRCKLTWKDVQQIRKLWEGRSEETRRGFAVQLARMFNCTNATILNIVKNKYRNAC